MPGLFFFIFYNNRYFLKLTNLAEIVVKADFKKEIVIKTHSLEMGLKKRERERVGDQFHISRFAGHKYSLTI